MFLIEILFQRVLRYVSTALLHKNSMFLTESLKNYGLRHRQKNKQIFLKIIFIEIL